MKRNGAPFLRNGCAVLAEYAQNGYNKLLASIKSSEKKELIDYVEQLWSAAFAEQQEAYLQGLLDAFQILFGLGMLSPNENVKSIIEKIKNDSSK